MNKETSPSETLNSSDQAREKLRHEKALWLGSTLLRILLVSVWCLPSDLRLWLQSTAFQSTITDPVYTIAHVREAMATRQLFQATASSSTSVFGQAYFGSKIHLPPLLLALLESLLRPVSNAYLQHVSFGLILILIDFIIARRLSDLANYFLWHDEYNAKEETIQKTLPEPIRPALGHVFPLTRTSDPPFGDCGQSLLLSLHQLPTVIALLYYVSPVTILAASVVPCFQTLYTLILLQSLVSCCQCKSIVWTAFWSALASYINIHAVIFIIPMTLILHKKKNTLAVPFVLLSLAFATYLCYLEYLLIGKDHFGILEITHLYTFQLHDVLPSLSTLWYLSMELFDRFVPYYTILLALIPYLLVPPLTIRLYRYPDVLIAVFWLFGVLFRPPGTLYALNVGFCFALMSPRSLARMNKVPMVVALCGIPIPVILYTVNLWLWLETGSGEANFAFFQCLAYNIFVGILVVDFCGASLRRDKALRLCQKRSCAKQQEALNENQN